MVWIKRPLGVSGKWIPAGSVPRASPAPSRSEVACLTASSSARWHTVETGMQASRTATARSSDKYTLIFGTRALRFHDEWGYIGVIRQMLLGVKCVTP
jgi:hypothetical protein